MNELWIDKYKPKSMEEVVGNKKTLDSLDNYVSNLKDNPKLVKNILISGSSGIGKTTIANILLKKHNYRIIEYNSNNIEGVKTIKNIVEKSLYHGNVLEMFCQDKKTTGLIIDEFDSLITLGAKGGLSELLSILHKSKKNKKITVPIIFTSKLVNDKKLTELRKYVKEFKLKPPTRFEISKLIQKILDKEKIKIDLEALNLYLKSQDDDIRNIINNLSYLCSSHKIITVEKVKNYLECKNKKDNDFQLYDGINKTFFSEDITLDELENIYSMDTFFIPLLIYENYIKILFSKKCTNSEKITILKKISDFNSKHDIIHDIIFKNNKWDIFAYMPYMTTVLINTEYKKYELLDKEINLNYRTIFTNISQYNIKYRKYVNIILNKNNNKISIKDIDYILKLILYYAKNKKINNGIVLNLLKYYNINYETFIDLIRLNKNVVSLIKKNDKEYFIKELD